MNVVNRGFEYVAQWMTGNYGAAGPGAGGYTIPTVIGWGTANGTNASSVLSPAAGPTTTIGTGQYFDVGPFSESTEARVAGTATVTGNVITANTVTAQITGTITSASAQAIGEAFLVFSTTKPYETSVASGAMTNVSTALTVSTVWPAVSTPFYLQIDNEVVVVNTTTSTLIASVIARGQNGSAAAGHPQNAGVSLGNIPGAGANNPQHGDLFAHAGFVQLSLNIGDSIAFTWQVGVTS